MSDQETKSERRLAAVMVTDIAGYSSLMESDEAGTFVALGTMRGAAEKLVRQHRGRIANTAGDSILAEFTSAVEAVDCALALQDIPPPQGLGSELRARIGIHLGDVLERNGDLFGTAVNIAARLEAMAEPGGIVVSSAIRDATAGKLPASFADLGLRTLKNIEQPIRVYALSPASTATLAQAHRPKEALPLPEKPSIAVLPFENLSGERDQEYFADGMVEEIITALSRFRQLFVIARNSSFAYKGRALDVKQVGRELGVRYILEGSVRKAGNRVRITGQLIDTATGAHLWADRVDGGLEDIFELQDQVTASVVGAIAPKLEQAEIERTKRKPTANLDAYDYYLRGVAGVHEWTEESTADAISNFRRAIELDPYFAAAYGMAARCYVLRKSGGWMTDYDLPEAARLARRAAELGKDDAVALGTAGLALSFFIGLHEDGKALTDRAISLNPNLAMTWLWSGWVRVWLGETETAIERVRRALRLSPNDPHSYSMFSALAFAHFFAGRNEEAVSWAAMAVREKSNLLITLTIAAASSALAGRPREAASALAQMRQLQPTLRMNNLQNLFPVRRPEDFAKLAEGMRRAGLPE
jgi:TolB-like protein/class 3 adenylate cyclase/tetratricopeptide (TPR) repeat protein